MKPAIFHPLAEAEFREAIAHYEGRREGLGDEFREAVEKAVQRIEKMPKAFGISNEMEGTRKCVLQRFPYTLFFLELEEQIWIAAVAHQRRKPGYWGNRRPEDPTINGE